jgi:hypothetical protein
MTDIPRKRPMYCVLNSAGRDEWTCAPRAPTVLSARMKSVSAQKTRLWLKPERRGVLYKIVDCARMDFHPCAVGDPRGRFFVRAKQPVFR